MVTSYCTDTTAIKQRLLIQNADTSYDSAINDSIIEASRLVDIFLKPYVSVPLDTVPDQIAHITADFTCSVFKRRLNPQEVTLRGTLQPDMINDIDGTGWFALALRKLEQYIKSYYTLAQSPIGTSSIYNPVIYLDLFQRGLITGKEARQYMASNYSIVTQEIQTLTKTLTETITRTATDTEVEYHTKTQHKFTFVESDKDGGYEEQS
jgi:hypothetical protein